MFIIFCSICRAKILMNTENVFFSFTGENNLLLNCFYFDFVIAVENFSDIFGWIWRVVISFQQQFFFQSDPLPDLKHRGVCFSPLPRSLLPCCLALCGKFRSERPQVFFPEGKKKKVNSVCTSVSRGQGEGRAYSTCSGIQSYNAEEGSSGTAT